MKGEIRADVVRELSTQKSSDVLWDTELPGFGVRVTRSGIKTFVVKYRNADGQIRKPKIGRFPEITVAAARKKALVTIAQVADGRDPSAEKQKKRQSQTFAEFFEDEYLPRYVDPYKKASSAEGDRMNFKNHLAPALGRKKLNAITPADVQRLHSKMKDTPYSANRCLALLSGIFSKAQQWGFYEKRNPCKHIKRYRERSRVRYLSPEEFRRLGEAINSAREKKLYSTSTLGAIEFLMWTGCRRGEAMHLKWDYIDFDRSRAHLPDSKTGEKELTLNPGAMALLDRMDRSSAYVFPSETNPSEPIKELKTTWRGLKRLAVSRMDCPFCDDDQQSGLVKRDDVEGVRFNGWRYQCEACGFNGDISDVRAKRAGQRENPRDLNPKSHEALVNELRKAGARVPVLHDLRMHDLRHAFATVAVSLQAGLPIIGELLGHRETKTTQKYAHVMDDAKRAVSVAVYERMREMMEPDSDVATVQNVELHYDRKQEPKAADTGGVS